MWDELAAQASGGVCAARSVDAPVSPRLASAYVASRALELKGSDAEVDAEISVSRPRLLPTLQIHDAL